MDITTLGAWLAGLSLTIAATGVSSFSQGKALLKEPKKYGGYLKVTGIACIAVAVGYFLIFTALAFIARSQM